MNINENTQTFLFVSDFNLKMLFFVSNIPGIIENIFVPNFIDFWAVHRPQLHRLLVAREIFKKYDSRCFALIF